MFLTCVVIQLVSQRMSAWKAYICLRAFGQKLKFLFSTRLPVHSSLIFYAITVEDITSFQAQVMHKFLQIVPDRPQSTTPMVFTLEVKVVASDSIDAEFVFSCTAS